MTVIKSYVINLPESTDRRFRLEKELSRFPSINVEFVPAVNGKAMTPLMLSESFDIDMFLKRMSRKPLNGEIGCTLSHQMCYKKLLSSSEKCVLILEDDIIINHDFQPYIDYTIQWLDNTEPRVMLFSGWYWFNRTQKIGSNQKVANVTDGFLTHAYAINRAGAKLLTSQKPSFLADSWHYFIKKGLIVNAFRPHFIDQDWSGGIESIILSEKKKVKYPALKYIGIKCLAAKRKILDLAGYMEHAQDLSNRISEEKV